MDVFNTIIYRFPYKALSMDFSGFLLGFLEDFLVVFLQECLLLLLKEFFL